MEFKKKAFPRALFLEISLKIISHHALSLCEKFALSVFMVQNSTESFAYAFWLPCFLCFTSISIFASIVPA